MIYTHYKSWQFIERFLEKNKNNLKTQDDFKDWCYEGSAKRALPISLKNMCDFKEKESFQLDLFLTKLSLSLKKEKVSNAQFQKNLNTIGKLLGLKTYEKEIINALFLYERCSFFEKFCDAFLGSQEWAEAHNLSLMIKTPVNKLCTAIQKNSILFECNILTRDNYRNKLEICSWIIDLLLLPECSEKVMIQRIVGKVLKSDLTLTDFEYIPKADQISKLLKNASKEKGINILLYGVPGTGKTEFAKAITKKAGLKLYSIAESVHNNRLTVCENRTKMLTFINKILQKDTKSVLLLDEAEDIFNASPFYRNSVSKVEINRLLENNTRPTIWITNNIKGMDKAYIRRFTKTVYFEEPSYEIRQKIWTNKFKKYGIDCDTKSINTFSKDYSIPPSFVENAIHTCKLINGTMDDVKAQLQEMEQAYHNGILPNKAKDENVVQFNPELLNTDVNLAKLCLQLKMLKRMDFSLCLYGAPGTGKSAFARYIANQLGLDIIQKRASDLLNKYVGGTEENIANAFAEAKKNKALLIFDEADSFLQDRRQATRSWEISQVNEMLTWMENHPYPFVCTTNLMDNLDPASLRRFTFKVKYDYLTPEQIQIAFQHFFNVKLDFTPELQLLSPGDFYVVKKKAEILGMAKDIPELINMLRDEQKCKPCPVRKIGFM